METNLWTYPETVGRLDLTGFEVEAVDGSIGKVDEATHEAESSFLVVDTGPWIFGKKVLIPAGLVARVDHSDQKIYVDRSKDEIEHAPEFDADNYTDEGYRAGVGDYYSARRRGDSEEEPGQEDGRERVEQT